VSNQWGKKIKRATLGKYGRVGEKDLHLHEQPKDAAKKGRRSVLTKKTVVQRKKDFVSKILRHFPSELRGKTKNGCIRRQPHCPTSPACEKNSWTAPKDFAGVNDRASAGKSSDSICARSSFEQTVEKIIGGLRKN